MQPDQTLLSPLDEQFLRRAIALSASAAAKGNMAFGALLADPDGNVLLEAENTTFTEKNALRHAETNLVEEALASLTPEQIAGATLYTSCEPCAMCSGSMYWGGINRMLYAMSEHDLLDITGTNEHCPTMRGVGCRNILETGQRHIEVSGPHLVEEASAVQHSYFGTTPGDRP
ncbi:MAG: nucleoside deaminase [bacterium]|nr:nucleoside deaminase [bacterium]